MFVLALHVELHIDGANSLKAKRKVVRALADGSRQRFRVAAAEVDHQDTWQRAALGFAAVSGSHGHAVDIIDQVERFVWSHPEVAVISCDRTWLEPD